MGGMYGVSVSHFILRVRTCFFFCLCDSKLIVINITTVNKICCTDGPEPCLFVRVKLLFQTRTNNNRDKRSQWLSLRNVINVGYPAPSAKAENPFASMRLPVIHLEIETLYSKYIYNAEVGSFPLAVPHWTVQHDSIRLVLAFSNVCW